MTFQQFYILTEKRRHPVNRDSERKLIRIPQLRFPRLKELPTIGDHENAAMLYKGKELEGNKSFQGAKMKPEWRPEPGGGVYVPSVDTILSTTPDTTVHEYIHKLYRNMQVLYGDKQTSDAIQYLLDTKIRIGRTNIQSVLHDYLVNTYDAYAEPDYFKRSPEEYIASVYSLLVSPQRFRGIAEHIANQHGSKSAGDYDPSTIYLYSLFKDWWNEILNKAKTLDLDLISRTEYDRPDPVKGKSSVPRALYHKPVENMQKSDKLSLRYFIESINKKLWSDRLNKLELVSQDIDITHAFARFTEPPLGVTYDGAYQGIEINMQLQLDTHNGYEYIDPSLDVQLRAIVGIYEHTTTTKSHQFSYNTQEHLHANIKQSLLSDNNLKDIQRQIFKFHNDTSGSINRKAIKQMIDQDQKYGTYQPEY